MILLMLVNAGILHLRWLVAQPVKGADGKWVEDSCKDFVEMAGMVPVRAVRQPRAWLQGLCVRAAPRCKQADARRLRGHAEEGAWKERGKLQRVTRVLFWIVTDDDARDLFTALL
jgi:hypothetical protein